MRHVVYLCIRVSPVYRDGYRRLLVVFYGLMVSIWCYMLVMYALEPSITLHPALHHGGAMFCSVALGVVSIVRLTTGRADSPSVE